jgi:RND superfamily putative drug exporter
VTGSDVVRIAAAGVVGILAIVGLARVIERGGGEEQLRSIETASSTAGRAVFFSGLAVIVSIAGLFLLDDPLFRSMAIGTIAVVFIAVVGSLTFLPAVLAILGNGLDAGRVPILGRDRTEGRGFWGTLVRFAMRRPLLVAATTATVLLVAASAVTRLHIGQSDFSVFPDRIDAVQAVALLDEKWPGGSTLSLQIVVTDADQPGTEAAIDHLSERVLAIDGVSGPVERSMSRDGMVALMGYVLAGTRNDFANHDIVREVRSTVVPEVFASLPGVEAYVAGPAASSVDVNGFYLGGMPLVFAFVLGLAFLLLLVAFHSIVIPIKSIVLNLLSTGAAYGLLVLVFQEGWLADILGFKPGVIEAFVPIFIFTILFGLSMDYHLFILTRVKEARDRGLDSNRAVERGITLTSGTITSAAAIMIVVFSVFVTLELVIIRQLGFGLAVAVFIDATIVRSLLLPATMRLLGEWNWWMPRALSWLPRITIEGGSEEPEEPEIPDDARDAAPAAS